MFEPACLVQIGAKFPDIIADIIKHTPRHNYRNPLAWFNWMSKHGHGTFHGHAQLILWCSFWMTKPLRAVLQRLPVPTQPIMTSNTAPEASHNSQTRPREATGDAMGASNGPQKTELSFESGVHFTLRSHSSRPPQRSPVLLVRVHGLVVRCYMIFLSS